MSKQPPTPEHLSSRLTPLEALSPDGTDAEQPAQDALSCKRDQEYSDLLSVIRPHDLDRAHFTDPLQSLAARQREVAHTAEAVVQNNRSRNSHFTAKQLRLMGLEPRISSEGPLPAQRRRRAAEHVAKVIPISHALGYRNAAPPPIANFKRQIQQ